MVAKKNMQLLCRSFVRTYATRIYSVNDSFLDNGLISHEHAWFWGWFLTDGNLYRNVIKWQLKYNSYQSLQNLRQIVGSTHPISFSHVNGFQGCYFRFTSKQLQVNIHSLLGCQPNRKTFELKFPAIDEVFLPTLIRSIIDGDGSWLFAIQHQTMRLQITSANKQFLEDVKCAINKYCFNTNKIHGIIDPANKSQNAYRLVYNRKDQLQTIGEWLYPDVHVGTNTYSEYKYNRYKLFHSLFIDGGVTPNKDRAEIIQQFRMKERAKEKQCLDELISMSRNEIDIPPCFRFCSSWHKHFNSKQ
eukprot:266241_1